MSRQAPVTQDFATHLTFISEELRRVVAVLVDRNGRVTDVIVGDVDRIYLPDLGRHRASTSRFRGVRLIRTTLRGRAERRAELTQDDLSDLSQLKLDMVITLGVASGGYPGAVCWAHLIPSNPEGKLWEIQHESNPSALEAQLDFVAFILEIEGEFQRKSDRLSSTGGPPTILVYVSTQHDRGVDIELEEMHELCHTAGVEIVDTIVQRRTTLHPKYAVGKGKLEDMTQRALQLDADLIIFGQDLTPGQLRAITFETDLKVIDRTQLILDIFAQHAKSKDGKMQVELAQLKYNLPRLSDKSTGLSRLTGGIGGRGPGETKLEINRRRARDRIRQLEKQIDTLSQQRSLRRERRQRNRVPVVAIVGYTNAGKSTLLNSLTNSGVLSEDMLFATLRPTSRQLQLSHECAMILTDTVGFIHELPDDLISAFKATLEELEDADILLHLVDASNEEFETRINAVDRILKDLGLEQKERMLAFNKCDRLEPEIVASLTRRFGAIGLSALSPPTCLPLVEDIEQRLFAQSRAQQTSFTHL